MTTFQIVSIAVYELERITRSILFGIKTVVKHFQDQVQGRF